MIMIECENVGVQYKIGQLRKIGLANYSLNKLKNNHHSTDLWANHNITFSLKKGDMLGIVGSNGSGKSTLLKTISGVINPTKGKVTVNGSLAALIELNSGFDPDMSVKENVFLRGAMLGYTKDFVSSKYNQIIEFAELEKFQEIQFSQLSSGMKSRIGFSIACFLEPDILILDEVFSVGDSKFKKKSANIMSERLSNDFQTGILVSHSSNLIKELCNKVLWLENGNQIILSEDVDTICDAYEEYSETNIMPKDYEEMLVMAQNYRKKEEARNKEKNIKQFKKTIKNLGQTTSLELALKIIKENKPELLK